MKLDDLTVKKLEEAFAIGASVSEACYYADISRQTYYNWEKENPELKEKFDRLKEKPVLKARQTIAKDLDKPETARWFLERKMKKEFSLRTEIDGELRLPQPLINVVRDNIGNAEDTKTEEAN